MGDDKTAEPEDAGWPRDQHGARIDPLAAARAKLVKATVEQFRGTFLRIISI
jgi:hypothetical protein